MMQTQATIRTQLSRNLLQYLERHTPDRLRSLEIQILLDLAAHAFRVPARKVWHLPADEALRAYADFTVHCMNTRHAAPRVLYRKAYIVGRRVRRITGLTDRGDAEKLVFYLYKNIRIQMHGSLSEVHAEPRGTSGGLSNVHADPWDTDGSLSDVHAEPHDTNGSLSDIHAEPRDTDGCLSGEITVPECYFSRYYTPEQCAIMSFVDSGIIAGICGTTDPASGYLLFTERITEGCGRCRACFHSCS